MRVVRAGRTPGVNADDFDILSAIWILSCNDENPIITYRGIISRLGLPDTFDIRALIQSRRELFRPGILGSRLKAWKDKMKSGHSIPGWISEIEDKAAREKVIEDLKKVDVFRNQFRTQDGAPKCGIDVMDWGLGHIERLRKSGAEEREARTKKWGTVVIPALSIALALAAVISSTSLGWFSTHEQRLMKQYEVSFKPKREAYSSFMIAITDAGASASTHDLKNLTSQLVQMDRAYFLFEPFLEDKARQNIVQMMSMFTDLCIQRSKETLSEDSGEQRDFAQRIGSYKAIFQVVLYENLFGGNAAR